MQIFKHLAGSYHLLKILRSLKTEVTNNENVKVTTINFYHFLQ